MHKPVNVPKGIYDAINIISSFCKSKKNCEECPLSIPKNGSCILTVGIQPDNLVFNIEESCERH